MPNPMQEDYMVFVGFFGNIIGVLIASVYEPTPPASQLLGKAPEDAALYTDSYKAKSRSIQLRLSLIGFFVPVVFLILWVILLVLI